MKKMIKIFFLKCVVSAMLSCLAGFAFKSAVIAAVILVFLLVCISIKPGLLVANKLVKKTNWYMIRTEFSNKFRRNISRNVAICNVGSTSARYAFDYGETGIIGENWALSPQTLSYDFRILKNYFSYLKSGAVVLLPLCPFSGCVKDFENDSYNFKYYSFLHPILINNYSPQTRKRIMKFVDKPFQSSPLKSAVRIVIDLPSDEIRTSMSREEIQKDADMRVESWKKEFNILDLDAPVSKKNMETISYNSALLGDIVNFCIERNLKPVIVIPPMSQSLSSKLSDGFRNNYILPLISKIPSSHLVLLNYLDDSRFFDTDLFMNSYLLNDTGRRIFTRQVIQDVISHDNNSVC